MLTELATVATGLGQSGMFGKAAKTSSATSIGYFTSGPFAYNKPDPTTWLLIAGAVVVFFLLTKGSK